MFEEVRSVADRYNVFCCGKRAIKHICTNPLIERDQLWNFDINLRGENLHIHSKQQYKNVLKRKGLVDVSYKDAMSVKKDQSQHSDRLTKLGDNIKKKVAKEGLSKHLDGAIKTMCKTN